ncbi:hypothetical protein LIA77_08320 [Sarocladium implicatum]|nr:hypothetical protein LIA77_08320 [Sarocladium implicatum]
MHSIYGLRSQFPTSARDRSPELSRRDTKPTSPTGCALLSSRIPQSGLGRGPRRLPDTLDWDTNSSQSHLAALHTSSSIPSLGFPSLPFCPPAQPLEQTDLC